MASNLVAPTQEFQSAAELLGLEHDYPGGWIQWNVY